MNTPASCQALPEKKRVRCAGSGSLAVVISRASSANFAPPPIASTEIASKITWTLRVAEAEAQAVVGVKPQLHAFCFLQITKNMLVETQRQRGRKILVGLGWFVLGAQVLEASDPRVIVGVGPAPPAIVDQGSVGAAVASVYFDGETDVVLRDVLTQQFVSRFPRQIFDDRN